MISNVYGKYTKDRAKIVMAANPEITDINHVKANTVIHFPSIPNYGPPGPKPPYTISLGTTESLAEGYDLLRNYKTISKELWLRPHLTKDGKLQFEVVFKRGYKDRETAQDALKKLPEGRIVTTDAVKKPPKTS